MSIRFVSISKVLMIALGLFSMLLASTAVAQQSKSDEPHALDAKYKQIAAQLSQIIEDQIEDKQIPAISIAIVDRDRVVMSDGFGYQDLDKTKPATSKTIYRVGSVSKLFTDLAVMQLVEAGKVSLDEPISTYLPDFKPLGYQPENESDYAQTTLRQLMSHRSGLVRESPIGNYFDPDEPSIEETVRSLNSTSLVYAPGTKTKYSNAGVAAVGLVLEKQAGKPFDEAINSAVLQPLGMNHSGFAVSEAMEPNVAEALMWTYDGRTFTAPTFRLGTAPAGNLYASVDDMTKFIKAIFHKGEGEKGRLLSEETFSSMMSPQFADESGNADFGLGFHLSKLDGHLMIGHGGAVYGFATQLEVLPEEQVGVIVACSKDVANAVMTKIATHAIQSVLAARNNKPLPEWTSTDVIPVERAKRLDGKYATEDGQSIRLIERNGEVFAKQGSTQYRLRSLEENVLVADDVQRMGDRFELSGAQGFRFQNRDYKRVADLEPPALLPEKFAGLVGEYGWDHNTMFVFERQGQLHCLIEWFFDYPLTEVDESTFEFPNYGLYHGEKIFFERGDDGTAKSATAAEVKFARRDVGTAAGETFKIEPVGSVDEIREGALAAEPPKEKGPFRDPELVEVVKLDDTIRLDIRYATTNNFMGTEFYQQPRAFMQRPAAEAVVRAHRSLKRYGYGILIHDAYRPWYVTKMFWDATPDDLKIFVANPANGSRHNRGCAVDLTLYDLKTGKPLWMGAGYDEFSPRSFPDYEVDSSYARWHRELLRDAMEAQGFTIYEFEWWHFDFQDWKSYTIQNTRFEDLP